MRISDWSSDVGSSDLALPVPHLPLAAAPWAAATDAPPGWVPAFQSSDVTLQRSYRLGGGRVDVHAAYYTVQREEAEAISDKNALLDSGKEWHPQDLAPAAIEGAGRPHNHIRTILAGPTDTYLA